jgi:hypothetical protein
VPAVNVQEDPIWKTLEDAFTSNIIENLTFRQWILTERCPFVTTVKSTEEITASFPEKMLLVLFHSFTATQQTLFLKEMKCNIQSGELVVLCNSPENYSFVLQDEVKGFHSNNTQATNHPSVIYFKKLYALNTQHENLVIIQTV